MTYFTEDNCKDDLFLRTKVVRKEIAVSRSEVTEHVKRIFVESASFDNTVSYVVAVGQASKMRFDNFKTAWSYYLDI